MHTIRLTRREVPKQGLLVVSAAGSFAAVAFIFSSPIIAAVLLIEATGLGGARQRIVLLPGLLGAGVGSLVSIGIGSLSGLSAADYALGPLERPSSTSRPSSSSPMRWRWRSSSLSRRTSSCDLGRETERFATPQPVAAAIIVGLIVAGLAFAFGQTTDESPVVVSSPARTSSAGAGGARGDAVALDARAPDRLQGNRLRPLHDHAGSGDLHGR